MLRTGRRSTVIQRRQFGRKGIRNLRKGMLGVGIMVVYDGLDNREYYRPIKS
jgi:hypothetical protein